MSRARKISIACTNDFLGSFSPMRTSYGSLPGGEGLKKAIEGLKDRGPTVWADAGDFAQGGPLAPMTGGVAGFRAASELGVDVAAAGNHEFDWGVEHLKTCAARLGFPLLCANADAGLPDTTIVPTEAGDVGFVGLTHPLIYHYSSHALVSNPDLRAVVSKASRRLREDGATFVVALLHDGIDWNTSTLGQHLTDARRLTTLCRPWLDKVDAIVAGHTLGRWMSRLDGTPVVQPWAFGAEVGVVELTPGEAGRVYTVAPDPAGPWRGAGSTMLKKVEGEVLGALDGSLVIRSGGPAPLADYLARVLREAVGVHAAFVPVVGMHQPAIEGVLCEWPEGPITEADLLRIAWWTDDAAVVGKVAWQEIEVFTRQLPSDPATAWGFDTSGQRSGSPWALVAVPNGFVAGRVDEAAGRKVGWVEAGCGFREAVRTALQDGAH